MWRESDDAHEMERHGRRPRRLAAFVLTLIILLLGATATISSRVKADAAPANPPATPLAGSSRNASNGQSIPAVGVQLTRPEHANSRIHANSLPPPTIVDTVKIPSGTTNHTAPTPTLSRISLQRGTYILRVTGTWIWGGCDSQYCPHGGPDYGRWGDAAFLSDDHFDPQYAQFTSPGWSNQVYLSFNGSRLNIGTYNPSHMYYVEVQWNGGYMPFQIIDCSGCYGDNVGSLSVQIIQGTNVGFAFTLGDGNSNMLHFQQKSPYGSSYSSQTTEENWGSIQLGDGTTTASDTIAKWGCFMSDWAMLINYYWSKYAQHLDVETLNSWLRQPPDNHGSGYTSGANLDRNRMMAIVNYEAPQHHVPISLQVQLPETFSSSRLQYLIEHGYPVIVEETGPLGSHFVLVTGEFERSDGSSSYYIYDPWSGSGLYDGDVFHPPHTLDDSSAGYNNSGLRLYWAQPTTQDILNGISIKVHSPAELLVTDPQGRRTGVDPTTGTTYNEIPGAAYTLDSTADLSGTTAAPEPIKEFDAISPVAGKYTTQVIGTGTGSYLEDTETYNSQGQEQYTSTTGQTQPGQRNTYTTLYPLTTLSQTYAASGTSLSLAGTGFAPNETVNVYWDSQQGTSLGSTSSDAQGGFSNGTAVSFSTPNGATGAHTIYAVGQTSGAVATSQLQTSDSTAPASTLTATNADGSSAVPYSWTAQNVTVALSASDNADGSGVKSITYSASGAQPISQATVNGNTVSVVVSTEGITTFRYYATDQAGNAETAHTTAIYIDKTPPQSTANPSPPPNASGWNTTGVSVGFSATDAGSGLSATYYAIDGTCSPASFSSCSVYDSSNVLFLANDGTHVISYFSADTAGNQEAAKTLTVKIDRSAPQTTPQPSPVANSNGWNNSAVAVILAASDAAGGSGVKSTYFAMDATCSVAVPAACQTYDPAHPPTFSTEGNHALAFYSTDNAGNAENAQSLALKIDSSPPVSSVSLSGTTHACSAYSSPVTVTLNAADQTGLSGVAATTYQLDGGTSIPYVGSIKVTAPGAHTVSYSSIDNAGNHESVKTTQFIIGPALTSIAPATGSYGDLITIRGEGFTAKKSAALYWDTVKASPVFRVNASPNCEIGGKIKIPESVGGAHTLLARDGSGTMTTSPFTVVPKLATNVSLWHAGTQATVSLFGFAASEPITLYWNIRNNQHKLGSGRTSAQGSLNNVSITVPKNQPPGTDTIVVVGGKSGTVLNYPLTVQPSLVISPSTGKAGTTVHLSAQGFKPHETVTIGWNCSVSACQTGTPLATTPSTVSADVSGIIKNVAVIIPHGFVRGKHLIGVRGTASGGYSSAVFTLSG